MTGIVELLTETARELHPLLVPVAIEDIAAFRWLVVDPPTDVTVRATTVAHEAGGTVRVKATIDGHARASVVLAPRYPDPPRPAPARLRNERPGRWRIHGHRLPDGARSRRPARRDLDRFAERH